MTEAIPEEAPEHCPGPGTEMAGKADPCAGCPNQQICAAPKDESAEREKEREATAIAARLSLVRHKVVVLSGKGGVGKSTVAATTAFALSAVEERYGAGRSVPGGSAGAGSDDDGDGGDCCLQVGLVDVDICGPSAPRMLGVLGEDVHKSATGWQPVYPRDNLGVVSVGFLVSSPDDAIIWRGPRKDAMIKTFLRDVEWTSPDYAGGGGSGGVGGGGGADASGEMLDYLLFDAPPGTSDEHLAVVQALREGGCDGAIVVTTPQEVSLADVRKELNFCRKVGLKVLGVIENMGPFPCPHCGEMNEVFPQAGCSVGDGGGEAESSVVRMARDFDVPFLGSIPLDPRVGMCCENGESFVEEFPDTAAARSFASIVDKIRDVCEGPRNAS